MIEEKSAKVPQEEMEDPKWPEGPEIVPESSVGKKKKSGKTMSIGELLERIHIHIDRAQEDIDDEFDDKFKEIKSEDGHFICRNRYWDLWFQKLFAQCISVKLWIIALITILLKAALITNIQFAAILGTIMALKGGFQVAGVFRKNGKNGVISAVDKT